mmetsp:Transcript_10418/g.20528  ORF Transcript_10418/g.20528 Transcript_10418/m.20528 type:complete len:506 (+) Transcript_10418:265-1782(+)
MLDFGPSSDVSSTDAVREMLAHAMDDGRVRVHRNEEAAKKLREENLWRKNYIGHFMTVQTHMLSSPEACQETSQAGLKALYDTMHWNGKPLAEVRPAPFQERFETGTVEGTGALEPFALPIPKVSSAKTALAKDQGGEIVMLDNKDAILKEIKKWIKEGFAEPNVLQKMNSLLKDHPEWLDLRGKKFVILGASSQMGPTSSLLRLGATIIAVDLPGDKIWEPLLARAEASAGKIIFPVDKTTGKPGANVVDDMPWLADWISNCIEEDETAVLGSYLYLDGAAFVRVATASDYIAAEVQKVRPRVVLSYLCSPTEPYCIPEEAYAQAQRTASERVWTHPGDLLLRAITMGRTLLPNNATREPKSSLLFTDNYVPEQGPNYGFAKLIQRWRTIISGPRRAIANVAPASLTRSMLSNPVLRMSILGCERFGVTPFLPETANAIMTALLVYDVENPNSKVEAFESHPMKSYHSSAVHGGTWRCAFQVSSAAKISVLVYAANKLNPLSRL